jgi:hypothetical protein
VFYSMFDRLAGQTISRVGGFYFLLEVLVQRDSGYMCNTESLLCSKITPVLSLILSPSGFRDSQSLKRKGQGLCGARRFDSLACHSPIR